MEIPKTYDPKAAENKWYSHWMEQGFFHSVPDEREPYTIVIPPPNVTGVLHMGHMLNNTIQDVLIRRARMMGKNACWVPGTDHASIATEAKVVNMLREQGIKKSDLSREKFLEYAWQWKEKYGGIILDQLKQMGASCDWERTRFTMEEDMSDAVIEVFVRLYEKGRIYRGLRMVNWDPQALTAVSDEEVIQKETTMRLFHVRYQLADDPSQFITVATTRPETIMADVAVAVNPSDERHKHLVGKKVLVPVLNKAIPVIADDYVDKEFGTGFLKVTPAHDKNDHEIGTRHNLPVIDILNPDGTLNANCEISELVGKDRFVARKMFVKMLDEAGQLGEIKEYPGVTNTSERTGAVIEPRLSLQWFVEMKELCRPALDHVLNDDIRIIPDKFLNTYRHWMENVRDWCISRQLWWGQRIPAYYLPDGSFVVARNPEKALEVARQKNPELTAADLKQDEDVVDTWFSSWLWPISVFDGFKNPENPDFKYYYPTNDLVTAPEILFFWVARMIIAGYEYAGDKPFTNVYLTGIVRDQEGRKMSKQFGNSPDPLKLINKYGADGMRVGIMFSAQAGNDIMFDTPLDLKPDDSNLESKLCEQGRNFANKIWNAFRLVKGWEVSDAEASVGNKTSVEWFDARFNEQLEIINDLYSKYRISEALMATYKLMWDDFCAWYLEMIKPEFVDGKGMPLDKATYDATILFFGKLLKLIHPFMPFITEEIWHLFSERSEKDCIIVAEWPKAEKFDADIISKVDVLKEVVANVRNLRQQKNISPKEKLDVFELAQAGRGPCRLDPIAIRLCNLNSYQYTTKKIENAYGFMVKTVELFVPVDKFLDKDEEKKRLAKELEYNQGFLQSVQKKLANERFVQNAKPELVELERQKQADAEAKIKAIEQQLQNL
ncbi:MAG: valyl-tRNA synthetase [Bacteroidetes bacterium]|nr:MAG: valyl-tRNA synthetase [Bacteroidota bacterium]